MSRADVPIDAMPPDGPVWHRWNRVGPTSDHLDSAGMNWPTVPACCEWCREYRPHVAVSLMEGTFGTTPEHWPGRCPVNDPKAPADTAWVSMTTDPPPMGSIGRGVLAAIGSMLILAGMATPLVGLFSGWPLWPLILGLAAIGLGAGLREAAGPTKTKRTTKPKKG